MKEQATADSGRMHELLNQLIPGLDEGKRADFIKYYELLIEWNNRMNLTAITDAEGVAKRHFADSIVAAELIPVGASCIDVGTGAGFPGIPLKIMRPDIELTLLDSLNKRILFLDEVCKTLGIRTKTIHARAEDGGHNPALRERFDIALSRAVAGVGTLAEWTLPFVKKGGCSLMYKGPAAAGELIGAENALRILGATAECRSYDAEWGDRNIIIVKKHGATPNKYPRKPGEAEKNPL